MSTLKLVGWRILPVDIDVKNEIVRERRLSSNAAEGDAESLIEAARWICRAQDSTPDKGVSRAYKACRYRGYGNFGWQASYPETTGYIIPTFFALSEHLENEEYRNRALRMADWETDIQMENGAVTGSVVSAPMSPAVFNTGQVIFGWIEAYRKTNQKRYSESARRAADYLLSVQDNDGAWRKGNSSYALRDSTVYNTRVAWALIEFGTLCSEEKYIRAGVRNIEFALGRQRDNGWFADNCLNDPLHPLLHTIVYATRGVLESGLLIGRQDYIDRARKTMDRIIELQSPEGRIPGRIASDWKPAAKWDCLTGNAQAAVAWLRLHAITRDEAYHRAARRAIDFLKKTQNRQHSNPGIRGGIKGSFPFDSPYGQFELLNWAAKFFCDALMVINNSELAAKGIRG